MHQGLKETIHSLYSQVLVYLRRQTNMPPYHIRCHLPSSHLTFNRSKWCIRCHKVPLISTNNTQSTSSLSTSSRCSLKTCSEYPLKFTRNICFNLIVFRTRSNVYKPNSYSSSKCNDFNGKISKPLASVQTTSREETPQRVRACQVQAMLLATLDLANATQ